MTNEEAKKMLKAKLECLKNETSGINHDCNMRLCEGCSLNYEQGNIGEQEEALELAIEALGSWEKFSDKVWKRAYARGCNDVLDKIREEIERKAHSGQWSDATMYGMLKAVAIVDKYKAESEDEE
jgi:hypothetical protein